MYPTDAAGRQQLADDLVAKGYTPTQEKDKFSVEKINVMVEAMQDGSFNYTQASLRPIVLGPKGEVLGGHHRIVAAHLAGVDLATIPGPRPQIQNVAKSFRLEYEWIDVLPDVQ
jgi:hypothetical protein